MLSEPCIETVVADSAAFLHNAPLQRMARQVVTCAAVVSEIRDSATRQRLQVLPYPLRLAEPGDHVVRQVSEFARRTGDLRFLSATDVRVLALTLQLTLERQGGAHLRLQPPPAADRIRVQVYRPRAPPCHQPAVSVADRLAGMTLAGGAETAQSGDGDGPLPQQVMDAPVCGDQSPDPAAEHRPESGIPELVELPPADGGNSAILSSEESDTDDTSSEEDMYDARETLDSGVAPRPDDDAAHSQEEQEAAAEDTGQSDDEGWITPANIDAAKAAMDAQTGLHAEPMKVACMTTDYTMQNVLQLMNLSLVALDGRRIRQTRRFVLRCFGCFQITPDTQKQFCPSCGHKTLKRVSVTLGPDGTQQVHISARKPISKRGTKFSLPLPRGGKYSVAPVLCADQPVPQQRASARSQARNAVVSGDYVPGASPFSVRDVTSRAAQLGRSGQRRTTHNWERRNPNSRAPPTGNKQKRRK